MNFRSSTPKISHLFKFDIRRHVDMITEAKAALSDQNLFMPLRRGIYGILFSGYAGATHYIDEKLIEVPPFSLLFIGPDRLSHLVPEVQPNTHILTFSDVFYNRSAKDAHFLLSSPVFHNVGEVYILSTPQEALEYSRGMAFLLYEAQKRLYNELSDDLAHNVIEQLLIVATARHHRTVETDYKENADHSLALQFRSFLNEHFVDEKSVQFYSDLLYVTDRRLTKATKAAMGLSPKEVIIQRIMTEARWQLIHTPKSVKEIAADLGFSGEQNFSAFFMNNEGIRPTQYRSQNRAGMLQP